MIFLEKKVGLITLTRHVRHEKDKYLYKIYRQDSAF